MQPPVLFTSSERNETLRAMNDDRTIVDYSKSKNAKVVPHATISIIATVVTPIGTTKGNVSFHEIVIGFVLQTETGKDLFENLTL
jgi:hypothetical protein